MLHSSFSVETISRSLEDVRKIPQVTPSPTVPFLEPPNLEATDTDDALPESGRCHTRMTSHLFFFQLKFQLKFQLSSLGRNVFMGRQIARPREKGGKA